MEIAARVKTIFILSLLLPSSSLYAASGRSYSADNSSFFALIGLVACCGVVHFLKSNKGISGTIVGLLIMLAISLGISAIGSYLGLYERSSTLTVTSVIFALWIFIPMAVKKLNAKQSS